MSFLMVYREWHPGLDYLDLTLGETKAELIKSGKLRVEIISGLFLEQSANRTGAGPTYQLYTRNTKRTAVCNS
jgi:hypothetical protein